VRVASCNLELPLKREMIWSTYANYLCKPPHLHVFSQEAFSIWIYVRISAKLLTEGFLQICSLFLHIRLSFLSILHIQFRQTISRPLRHIYLFTSAAFWVLLEYVCIHLVFSSRTRKKNFQNVMKFILTSGCLPTFEENYALKSSQVLRADFCVCLLWLGVQ